MAPYDSTLQRRAERSPRVQPLHIGTRAGLPSFTAPGAGWSVDFMQRQLAGQ